MSRACGAVSTYAGGAGGDCGSTSENGSCSWSPGEGVLGVAPVRLAAAVGSRFVAAPATSSADGEASTTPKKVRNRSGSVTGRYPPNRYVSKQLRVFIDWIVELMAVHAPRGPLTSDVQRLATATPDRLLLDRLDQVVHDILGITKNQPILFYLFYPVDPPIAQLFLFLHEYCTKDLRTPQPDRQRFSFDP